MHRNTDLFTKLMLQSETKVRLYSKRVIENLYEKYDEC